VLYGLPEPATREHWDRHIAYLKQTVPEDRLIFFDVKDGWAPLCTVLGKAEPDEEFPRINDGKAIEELASKFVVTGLMRWGVAVLTAGGGVASIVSYS
jgi:hypothetical protein